MLISCKIVRGFAVGPVGTRQSTRTTSLPEVDTPGEGSYNLPDPLIEQFNGIGWKINKARPHKPNLITVARNNSLAT
jgi:hypothetical protein